MRLPAQDLAGRANNAPEGLELHRRNDGKHLVERLDDRCRSFVPGTCERKGSEAGEHNPPVLETEETTEGCHSDPPLGYPIRQQKGLGG
jgi:hypothetical protein